MTRRFAPIVLCLLIASCTRSNMDSQPKYHEYEPAKLFRDGKEAAPPGKSLLLTERRLTGRKKVVLPGK